MDGSLQYLCLAHYMFQPISCALLILAQEKVDHFHIANIVLKARQPELNVCKQGAILKSVFG